MSTRNVYTYPTHIAIDYTAGCGRCEAGITMTDRGLVQQWEATHSRFGCRVALALDHRPGQGWYFRPAGFLSARKIRAKPRRVKIEKEAS